MRTEFVIHVCPVCDFYDADPILRRVPGGRHGPKRCFPCAEKAVKALDLSRTNSNYVAWRKQEARDSAPEMIPVVVACNATAPHPKARR